MKDAKEKAKYEYSKFTTTACPSIGNELVYFYRSGLVHLLRKGQKFRPQKDLLRRIRLLKFAEEILSSDNLLVEYDPGKSADFWRIHKQVNDRTVIVVVRQFHGNKKHFFSIMDRKIPFKNPPLRGFLNVLATSHNADRDFTLASIG